MAVRRQEIGVSFQTITSGMAASLGLVQELRRHRLGRLASRPGRGGRIEGRRHPAVHGWSARGQPADRHLQLPPERVDRAPVNWWCSEAGPQQKLSVEPVEERSEFDSVAGDADPQQNLVAELGILGVEIDQRIAAAATGLRDPLRRHRRRPRRRRRGRGAAAAEGRHPQRQQPENLDAQALRDAVRALKPGAPVTLQVQREGRVMYVSFTLD